MYEITEAVLPEQWIEVTKETLTDIESILYLLDEGEKEKMKGTVRPKGKCRECGSAFEAVKKLGFICSACKILPTRFYIDLPHKGQRIRLFSDKQGQPLDSYQRATKLLSSINAELDDHTFDPSKYIKADVEKFWVQNVLERFLAHKIDSIAPSYQKDYRRHVELAKGYFKTRDVRDIRKIDIISYKEHLEKTYKLSGKTTKNILDLFKTCLRYCKYDLEIIDNVPAFPDIETSEHKFKWLSQDDQIKLFEVVPERDKPIIAFLILHGCRPSEARALRCKDIDPRSGTLTISATFSGRIYREKRKGRKSKAVTIPIHPEMIEYVIDRVRSNLPEAYMFVNPRTGQHYTESAIDRLWRTIRMAAGIDSSLRLYDATRHSFASQLINSGTSLFKVSKLLGHSSVRMTEKYAHHNIEGLKSDIGKMSLKSKATVTRLSPDAKEAEK